jgi:indole-3-glycerol phosphate synthase
LDEIVETKRGEVAAAKAARPVESIRADAERAEAPRDFMKAVAEHGQGVAVIAEIKKASPSAGLIVKDFDPVRVARTYADHGAAAISVLTDRRYFQGDPSFIGLVKRAVRLPVLRKDFIVEAYQVFESRALGADAILLIAEVLGGAGVAELLPIARRLGMTALVEVHDNRSLDAVLDAVGSPADGAYLLGFNNRDLKVQKTDLSTTSRLARRLEERSGNRCPFIAESGIHTPDDVRTVRAAGAWGILVGESLLKDRDIGAKLDELRNA